MDPILWDFLSDHFKQVQEIPEVPVPKINEPSITTTKVTLLGLGLTVVV